MNFERITEHLKESSNQSRFVLALSLSTVMALAVSTPLAVKAFSADSQNASELQLIDPKGPSTALLDQEGNTVFVPQAAVPLSATIPSPQKSSTPATVERPSDIDSTPRTTPTPTPPTTNTGESVTVQVSPAVTTTTTGSTTGQSSTTNDQNEPTTTEDNGTTTVEDTDTTTDTETTNSVAPEPTLSDPPATTAE